MNLGGAELLILLLILFFFLVVPVWGILDAALKPDSVWSAADQSKVVWIVLQVFLWTLGALIYFVAIRPRLRAVQSR